MSEDRIPKGAMEAALAEIWAFDYGHCPISISYEEGLEQVEAAICAALEWMAEND